jgi:vacuolar-type H+-ATPase subunit E/Vma4
VGYGELLRALADEARADAEAVRAAAGAERDRLLSAAREAAERTRATGLDGLRAELAAAGARARARAEAEADGAALVEVRRLLDDLREDAARALLGEPRPALTLRLLDGALEDDRGEPLEIRVDPAEVAAVRDHLAARHPGAAARARVVASDEPRGGVEVRLGDALVVDETLRSRLDRACALLEPELAGALLGGPDGAL